MQVTNYPGGVEPWTLDNKCQSKALPNILFRHWHNDFLSSPSSNALYSKLRISADVTTDSG